MSNEDFFSTLSKPVCGGGLVIMGILLILAAYFNWDWMFAGGGSSGVWNLEWFEGAFGRTAARILVGIVGVITILGGIVFIIVYWK